MKRYLSVLLVLLMVLSMFALVGCAKEEAPAAGTETPAAGTEPPANGAAAGTETPAAPPADAAEEEKGFIGVVAPALGNEWLVNMLTSFCNRMEEIGYTTQLLDAGGDPAQFIPIMDNYVTMGAKLILNVAMDTDSCKDVTLRCIDQGCYVIMLGVYPEDYEISGGVASDFYATGVASALMLIDWFDQFYPELESIPCALQYSENTQDATKRSHGFRDAIEADDRCFISYFKTFNTPTVDNGFLFAEEALTYDNTIRGFLMYDTDPAIGVQNYLSQSGIDMTDLCIIAVGQTEASLSLMEQAKTDPANYAIRGLLSYGGADPGETLYNIAVALLDGTHEAPYWIFDPMYTMNNWGWEIPEGMN